MYVWHLSAKEKDKCMAYYAISFRIQHDWNILSTIKCMLQLAWHEAITRNHDLKHDYMNNLFN